MPNIKPLRDLSEHDVFNGFYAWGGTIPQTKGVFVKINSGWSADSDLSELGNPGQAYTNTVAQRVGLTTNVTACDSTGDNAIGLLLYDVKETDENGILLKWDAAKQARMQCVLSGQSTVIAQRGKFLYSGVDGGNPMTQAVSISAGAPVYLASDGGLTVSGSADLNAVTKVGKFLGLPDKEGWVLVDIQL